MPVSQTGFAGIVVYNTIFIIKLTYKTNILNIESCASEKTRLGNGRYTHYEVVLGISGQEFARNFDFSIEQNQRLSKAKSRIL